MCNIKITGSEFASSPQPDILIQIQHLPSKGHLFSIGATLITAITDAGDFMHTDVD